MAKENVLEKAKDFAIEITIFNAKEKTMCTKKEISAEHTVNNKAVWKILASRGIAPENLSPEVDVKRLKK